MPFQAVLRWDYLGFSVENWQRAFVLHRREYGETSLIVDLFSEETGRLSLLAKGARRKNSPWKSLLQPFTPLLVKFSGRGALKTLTKAEAASLTLPLSTVALYSGFYVNELMVRLLERETPYPDLFQYYLDCLTQLAQVCDEVESPLRTFEFQLLTFLGYAVDFCHCAGTGKAVEADMRYRYREEQGFIAVAKSDQFTFYGRELLAFDARDFSDKATRLAAKRFIRFALKPYLGDKPLKSRELFSQMVLGNHRLKLK